MHVVTLERMQLVWLRYRIQTGSHRRNGERKEKGANEGWPCFRGARVLWEHWGSPIPLQGAKALSGQLSETGSMLCIQTYPNAEQRRQRVMAGPPQRGSSRTQPRLWHRLPSAAPSWVLLPSCGCLSPPLVWTSVESIKACEGDHTSQPQEYWAESCPGGGGLSYCWAFTPSKILFYRDSLPLHPPVLPCKVRSV